MLWTAGVGVMALDLSPRAIVNCIILSKVESKVKSERVTEVVNELWRGMWGGGLGVKGEKLVVRSEVMRMK